MFMFLKSKTENKTWFVLLQDAGIRLVVIGQSDHRHIEVTHIR